MYIKKKASTGIDALVSFQRDVYRFQRDLSEMQTRVTLVKSM